ncbi:COA8 family protein Y39B6A.34, mitochondrial-like [Glandiceps talaboti]
MSVSQYTGRLLRFNGISIRCVCNNVKESGNTETVTPLGRQQRKNWIGPPHKLSNIRQVKYYIPDNESIAEKRYRLMREDNDRFNHQFWLKHNAAFIKAKEEFIANKEKEVGDPLPDEDGTKYVLTAEEMAKFYRQFLNDQQQKLKDYNREWYMRNLRTLWPALKANFYKTLYRR